MDPNDPLYVVLDFILNQATTAQLEVIGEALKRRTADSPAGNEGLNPRRMAQRLSRNIVKQLGASLDVPQIARRIVRDLIKHKEPNIQDREVEILLDNWLPGTRQAPPAESLPPDALATMVATYLAAERGTLSPEESGGLPVDWRERYWQSFPSEVREAIEELRRGEIDEARFWASLIGRLQR
jgi:uncharacterized protein with HEPN domain